MVAEELIGRGRGRVGGELYSLVADVGRSEVLRSCSGAVDVTSCRKEVQVTDGG